MRNETHTERKANSYACLVENYSYRRSNFPDEEWVLRNIELEIEPGETVAMFGDSGSGKTTLLSSMAGLNHHFFRGGRHEGSISLFGESVSSDISSLVRKFGFVSQDFHAQVFSDQVENAIAFPLENLNVPHGQMHKEVENILHFLGIEGLKNMDVSELSGGQSQAVVIATMLVKNPEIMIFDDVTSDLDRRGQIKTQEIIALLKKQGKTILIVDSSDPKHLLNVADKVLVFNGDGGATCYEPSEIINDKELSKRVGIIVPEISFREEYAGTEIVKVDKVSFAYNSHPVLNEISCNIKKGSITGIIGPNGSGKTTLAKIVAGIYKPKNGVVTVDRHDISEMSSSETVRIISYLHQQAGSTFFMETVGEELNFTPKLLGMNGSSPLIPLDLSGLDDEHPSFLSAGQQQRLALGCALSSNPEIVILDEPTTGLNQRERTLLAENLIRLQNKGKTIILISHDWKLIARATQDVLVVDNGKIAREGATSIVMKDRKFFNRLGLPLPW